MKKSKDILCAFYVQLQNLIKNYSIIKYYDTICQSIQSVSLFVTFLKLNGQRYA